MSIISLEEKRLRIEKKKQLNNPDDEPSEFSSGKLGFSKIVQMGHFVRLKQTAHWENIKLRNGLVQKIHDIRRLAESSTENLPSKIAQNAKDEFLMIASNFVDEVLYSEEFTVLELLNKYMEYKNIISAKVEVFTKTQIYKLEDWSLEEHLSELRNRILYCVLFSIPALVLGFLFTPYVLRSLEALAPKGTIFFQLKPGELLFVYFRLSFIIGGILSMPFYLKQIADFLYPGLKKREREICNILFIGGPLLFFLGAIFTYFIALKPLLAFLLGFGVDLSLVQPQYSLDYFVALVLGLILIFGITFQIPILLFVLALLNLVSSNFLWTYWRQAIFASFVISAIATPTPDPLNMFILACAIICLYIISLALIKFCGK